MSDTQSSVHWWERTAELVPYAGLRQGDKDHCVFAAVAGAVNHLLGRQAWTIDSLIKVHGEDPNTWTLAVAHTAIAPFLGRLEVLEHNTSRSRDSSRLSPAILRSWIREGGIVILSLPGRKSGWHMFTLVACTDTSFQVWDSNGIRGRFYDHEIKTGIPYGKDHFFDPHPEEDLVVIRKRYSLFSPSP